MKISPLVRLPRSWPQPETPLGRFLEHLHRDRRRLFARLGRMQQLRRGRWRGLESEGSRQDPPRHREYAARGRCPRRPGAPKQRRSRLWLMRNTDVERWEQVNSSAWEGGAHGESSIGHSVLSMHVSPDKGLEHLHPWLRVREGGEF